MANKKDVSVPSPAAPSAPAVTVEDLLDQAGGFGLFQLITTFCLFYNKFMTGWSMFQMAFAGIVPSWVCEGPEGTDPQNWTIKSCRVMVNASSGEMAECQTYNFTGDKHTIISEWDLVCDLDWVEKAVTSIQMGGLLVGALLAGQMGDVLGRRRTTYLFVLEHSVLNILIAFSPSWQVFAICRFFIGLGVGGILVAAFTLGMEFLPTRWRPMCACLPVWAMGVSMFALTAWLLEDWAKLHLICGVCGLPAILGYFYVPESLRYLTVKGRLEEAESVVAKIARTNGKPFPPKTSEILQAVAQKEREVHENEAQYTYLDLFRDAYIARITLIFCFEWFSFSVIFYGISFGISALAGNLYLNIFLMDALVVPLLIVIFFTKNIIGRRMTALPLLLLATVTSFTVVALLKVDSEKEYGEIITGLSLTAKTGIGASWAVLQTWGTEIYPTVTRNLGYGAANTAARVGGIIMPYVIDLDDYMVPAYIVISILLLVDTLLLLLLPETKGTVMSDSLAARARHSDLTSPWRKPGDQEERTGDDAGDRDKGEPNVDGQGSSVNNTPNGATICEEMVRVKPEVGGSYGSTAPLLSGSPYSSGFPETNDGFGKSGTPEAESNIQATDAGPTESHHTRL
ncbi:solute carrier family 22 member 21 [Plakobranchus ocellatus]|uniref:Solute carrier family 22 member 21 n=1 Tax=Plakobranchus ocellatus TaxID=259542 RepID=A0AAV4BD67_9GAST|nr:solute carrier family 22 member 21 [Plakobranchus ocellatus]